MDELSKIIGSLESDLVEINNTLAKVKAGIEKNGKSNKEIEEEIQVKKKMINLINDAPMNILRLKVYNILNIYNPINSQLT